MNNLISRLILRTRIFKQLDWIGKGNKLKNLKLLALDVDGVLTDGGLWLGFQDEPLRRFDVKDGLAIRLLKNEGIKIAFISGGKGISIDNRAKQLFVDYCFTGVKDKSEIIKEIIKITNIPSSEIGYVGDDLNDLPVKEHVCLFIVPANAPTYIKEKSDLILSKKGGEGAIKELAIKILRARKTWLTITKYGWKDIN